MGFSGWFNVSPIGRANGLNLWWDDLMEVDITFLSKHIIDARVRGVGDARWEGDWSLWHILSGGKRKTFGIGWTLTSSLRTLLSYVRVTLTNSFGSLKNLEGLRSLTNLDTWQTLWRPRSSWTSTLMGHHLYGARIEMGSWWMSRLAEDFVINSGRLLGQTPLSPMVRSWD